jgi:hypothetical protein
MRTIAMGKYLCDEDPNHRSLPHRLGSDQGKDEEWYDINQQSADLTNLATANWVRPDARRGHCCGIAAACE